MHIPTPHLHKRAEKRKASLDSVAHSDVAHSDDGDVPAPAVEKKSRKSKKKARKTKAKKETLEATSVTPDDAPIRPATPLSASPVSVADPTTPPHTTAADQAVHESPEPTTTDAETQTPRRSSRLRNSISSVSSTWDKCRPYIERINGTIMPLAPQGTTAYYKRDGVAVD